MKRSVFVPALKGNDLHGMGIPQWTPKILASPAVFEDMICHTHNMNAKHGDTMVLAEGFRASRTAGNGWWVPGGLKMAVRLCQHMWENKHK